MTHGINIDCDCLITTPELQYSVVVYCKDKAHAIKITVTYKTFNYTVFLIVHKEIEDYDTCTLELFNRIRRFSNVNPHC